MDKILNNTKLNEAFKKLHSLWVEDHLIGVQIPITLKALLDEYKDFLTEEDFEEIKKLVYETGDEE